MAGEIDLFSIEPGRTRPHEELLSQVVSSTFEKMGFMGATPTEEKPPQAHTLTATMDILVPVRARIFFTAPQQLGWTIAENLYGLEDLTLEAVEDIITELLNTIGGSLLSTLMPTRQFNLSIPTLCEDIPADQGSTYTYHFNIDKKGIITIVLNNNDS